MSIKEEIIQSDDLATITTMSYMIKHKGLKKRIVELMIKELKKNQKLIVFKAIEDGFITVKEINEIKAKYNCGDTEIAELFKPKYDKGFAFDDNKKEETTYLITMENSKIYKMKDFIKERFNIKVILKEEAMKRMESFNKSENPNYIG